MSNRRAGLWPAIAVICGFVVPVRAAGEGDSSASDSNAGTQMSGMAMDMPMGPSDGWHFMQDGRLDVMWNRQGGPRGGREIVAPNWWMGMAERRSGRTH